MVKSKLEDIAYQEGKIALLIESENQADFSQYHIGYFCPLGGKILYLKYI